MHKTDRFLQLFLGKVETSEVAGIGIILQADVNRIGAVFDSRLKRRKISGRAEQFPNVS
jgi:hypothetical protein